MSRSLIKFILCSLMFLGVLCLVDSLCRADTFTHRDTGEVLHGYATSKTEDGKTLVNTHQKGPVGLNLTRWNVSRDEKGRNNKVIVITIEGPILHEIETNAFERAIVSASDEGPLFILLEIDTPGGRIDLASRICAAISDTGHCVVVGFIKGGGALSAGAAVALACDKIYMSSSTVIGSATMITSEAETMKEAYGDEVGEKFNSAWRATLASLAQQNNRPGLLARAMVDSDIEVVEISESGRRLFIDPIDRKSNQGIVHTWSKKGSLLALTANEAVSCTMADKIAETRQEVLLSMNAEKARVVVNKDVQNARTELKRAEGQLKRIRKSVDLKSKQLQASKSRPQALKLLRAARMEFKTLIKLAKKYPDLGLDVQSLEDELNTIQANYEKIKMGSR